MTIEKIQKDMTEPTFPVSVILDYPSYAKHSRGGSIGEVVGVVGTGPQGDEIRGTMIRSGETGDQYLWSGYRLRLFEDDVESYYCNLMGKQPSVFVISRKEDEGKLKPFLVTVSYDEATAHMEVDDMVASVPIPPEIYRWVETFVLAHYVPERKKKRKRDDWKKDPRHS